MKRFTICENGYDVNEVNRFIDIVIRRLEKLNTENSSYQVKIEQLEHQLLEKNRDDDKISKVLLAASNASDNLRQTAEKEAETIISEAKNNATSIVHEALLKAEKIEHDMLIVKKNMKIYKAKMKSIMQAGIELSEELDKEDFE